VLCGDPGPSERAGIATRRARMANNLHERGALTDEEFASEKSLVVGKR
jgi:hypothetical protein